ncbi:MAG: lactate utilization protein C [Chloroflexota bacterium]|jgi:L-lactate dehydrogenase complex protein LldG
MSNSRDAMLQRIRHAVTSGTRHYQHPSESAAYEEFDQLDENRRIEQFAHRVEEYKAWVGECNTHEVSHVIRQRIVHHGYQSMVIPYDFAHDWRPIDVALIEDNQLSPTQIASSDGVISTCALGIAQTGTIVLDGGVGQGRRMLTLLPDYHCCVVPASLVVGTVPEAFARLGAVIQARRAPMTFISGPSATSDIELNRVEGVHGPRTLEVIIVRNA